MDIMNNLELLDNNELLAITRWHLSRDDFGQALIYYKLIAKQKNAPDEAFKLGGKIYAELGLFEYAEKSFKKFIDRNPDEITEIFQYGMVHLDKGDTDAAVKIWDDLLLKEPNHPPTLFYSALTLSNNKKSDKAKKHLETLIKTAPSDNLYFEKSRDLLLKIENNLSSIQNMENQEDNNLKKYKKDDKRTLN
jgi:tetratricopeptide (TPR) repeat protein